LALLIVLVYVVLGVATYVVDDVRNSCSYEMENGRVLVYVFYWPFSWLGVDSYFCPH
jgi:hypothetical protein